MSHADHDHGDGPHEHDDSHGHVHPGHSHAGHSHAGYTQPRHGHSGPGHLHAPASFGRAFALGIALNVAFVLTEATVGWLSNSVALLADAGHNLSDVLGLAVAWVATRLAARRPSARFTYGLRGSSILAALANAVLLLVAVGGIGWEAIMRILHPEPTGGLAVIVTAGLGILVNGATALLFMSGRKSDLNINGAFLHMAADAGVSLGVVIAGIAVMFTGALWLDPLASLAICLVIIWSTWSLLRESLVMSLAAVPASVDPAAVRRFLMAQPGVDSVHDLHIWSMSTTEIALTAHLVMSAGHPGDRFLQHLAHDLAEQFGIAHPTVQIETDRDTRCELAPDEVV